MSSQRCERTGKIIYKSYEQAQYQKKWRKKHYNQRTGSIYKCQYCNGWHATSAREVEQKQCPPKRKPYNRAKIKRGSLSAGISD
jgi:hypothetical protein